ncbi:MAG TPA: hypothetical protein VGE52_12830 [Pirellulales bacterium]
MTNYLIVLGIVAVICSLAALGAAGAAAVMFRRMSREIDAQERAAEMRWRLVFAGLRITPPASPAPAGAHLMLTPAPGSKRSRTSPEQLDAGRTYKQRRRHRLGSKPGRGSRRGRPRLRPGQ